MHAGAMKKIETHVLSLRQWPKRMIEKLRPRPAGFHAEAYPQAEGTIPQKIVLRVDCNHSWLLTRKTNHHMKKDVTLAGSASGSEN